MAEDIPLILEKKLSYVEEMIGFYFGEDIVAHVNKFGMGAAEIDSWFFKARVFVEVLNNKIIPSEEKLELFDLVEDAVNDYEAGHALGEAAIIDKSEIGIGYSFDRDKYVDFIESIPAVMGGVIKEDWFAVRSWESL